MSNDNLGLPNRWNGIRTGIDWNKDWNGMEQYGIAKTSFSYSNIVLQEAILHCVIARFLTFHYFSVTYLACY